MVPELLLSFSQPDKVVRSAKAHNHTSHLHIMSDWLSGNAIKLNLNDEIALKTTEHTSAAHKLFDYNSLCDLNSIFSPGKVEKQTRFKWFQL